MAEHIERAAAIDALVRNFERLRTGLYAIAEDI